MHEINIGGLLFLITVVTVVINIIAIRLYGRHYRKQYKAYTDTLTKEYAKMLKELRDNETNIR